VLAGALDEIAGILERLDRRIAAAAGIDPLQGAPTPKLNQVRGYCAELRAQAAWEAGEAARIAQVEEATRAHEAAEQTALFQHRQELDFARRTGRINWGMARPR